MGWSGDWSPPHEPLGQSQRVRRRIEHAHSESDKRVLNKQIEELKSEIDFLRTKVD